MQGVSCKCSIIMPVRNGAPYIKRAVQSVLEQSFSDWALIIVNDASTDATEDAVAEFLPDDRIRYISCAQPVGVSRARNIGLDNAAGRYVIFLDCDDRLTQDSIKNRIDEMDKHAAEMGFFGSAIRRGNDIAVKQPQPAPCGGGYTAREFMSRVSRFQAGETVGLEYVWDKIFSLDIIREQKLRFDEGWGRFEDRKFVMDYLRCCSNEKNSVWISPICVYEYYVNAGSISNSYDPRLLSKTRSCFLYIRKNLEYYDIFKGDVAEGYYHGYLNKIIGCVMAQKTRKQQKELEKQLLGDEDFLEGLRRYEIRNQYESREIPDRLKNKFL